MIYLILAVTSSMLVSVIMRVSEKYMLIFRHVDRLFAGIADGCRDDNLVAGQNHVAVDFHSDTHARCVDFVEMRAVLFEFPFLREALNFIQIENVISSAVRLLGQGTDAGFGKFFASRQLGRKLVHAEF